jgi:hypothetical protein
MASLAKPTKDMLMGSTGAADPIFPLSMVASHRHQSIINMNENGSARPVNGAGRSAPTFEPPLRLHQVRFEG